LPASKDKPEDERHPGRRGAWFDWQPALFDQETALGAAERCELYRASPGLRGGGFLMHNQGYISLYRRVTCLTFSRFVPVRVLSGEPVGPLER